MERENSPRSEPEKLAEKVSDLETPVIEELPHLHQPVREEALHPKNAASKILISVVAVYITALGCAIAHYRFLKALDNTPVPTGGISYSFGRKSFSFSFAFWIKGANNLCSKAVGVGLSYVTSVALVQVSWHTFDRNYTPIALIDDIFSLPSPLSTLNFVRKFKNIKWLPTLAIALLVNFLVLVSIFGPSALTTGSGTQVHVPSLDPASSDVETDTRDWKSLIPNLIGIDPSSEWAVPEDCKAFCDFTIRYPSPRLLCSELATDQITLPAYNSSLLNTSGWDFYETDANYSTPWGKESTDLVLRYRLLNAEYNADGMPVSPPIGTVGGQQCHFSDASYIATFIYSSGQRIVTTAIDEPINHYQTSCDWNDPDSLVDNCKIYGQAAQLIRDGFIDAISGPWTWYLDGVFASNALQIQNLIDYTNNTSNNTVTLSIPSGNLSAALEEAFANISLTTLMRSTQNGTFSATINDTKDGSVWYYNPDILWGLYAPAFTFVLAAVIYSLYGVAQNGAFWDRSFSTIFIATRSKDLDAVYFQDQQTIRDTLLRHDALHGKFIAHDSTSHSPTTPRYVTLTQTTAHTYARTIMLGGCVAAAIVAFGHHLFLQKLDTVLSQIYPQSWIRGISNGFSTVVVICLGTAASFSLTQANWRTLKLHSTNLKTLDALYSLPQMTAILNLARAVKSMHLLYVAVIAVLIQGLVLVSLLAPGALETAVLPPFSVNMSIPQLNFSSTPFAGSDDPFNFWTQKIDQTQALSTSKLWNPPWECEDGCSFSVSYSAPMLTCRDIRESEQSLTSYNTSMGFNKSWAFYAGNETQSPFVNRWLDTGNPSFFIEYMPISFNFTTNSLTATSLGPAGGSVCTCRDGTYNSTFVLSGNQKTITTSSPTLGNQLSTCPWNSTSIKDATECGIYAANSLGFCQTFADLLQGGIQWDADYHLVDEFVPDSLLLDKLFDYYNDFDDNDGTMNGTVSLQPKNGNLTVTIVDVFNNVTVGLLPQLDQATTENILVNSGFSVWVYKPRTL